MRTALPLLIALIVAGCGTSSPADTTGSTPATTTTTTSPPATAAAEPLLQADLVGGCYMMGPNCTRYLIYTDAMIEVYRLGNDAPELLWTETIDTSIVSDLQQAIEATDLEELRSRLRPGTCNACVDGIDTVLTFIVDGNATVFDSAEVELDTTELVFITAATAVQAASATGEIPIVSR